MASNRVLTWCFVYFLSLKTIEPANVHRYEAAKHARMSLQLDQPVRPPVARRLNEYLRSARSWDMDLGIGYDEAFPKDLRRIQNGNYRNRPNNKQRKPTLWNLKITNQKTLAQSHETL